MEIHIVLLDDSKLSLKIYEQMLNLLKIPYALKIVSFTQTQDALNHIRHHVVDMVLTDMMPDLSGIELLKTIKSHNHLKEIFLIMVTAVVKKDLVLECLELGATDFLRKPIEKLEFLPKMRNLIELVASKKLLKNKIFLLDDEITKATQTIKERESEIIHRLAVAAEYRDQETGNHIHRVAAYSKLIAKNMGLTQESQELIEKATPLHDIGKIALPDAVLLKPDKLTEKEWVIMKNHTLYGYKILHDPNIELLKVAAKAALYHHEKWDGSGYPYGKKGHEIPLSARIVAIADVFDAWTSERRYKEAWDLNRAFLGLKAEKEKSFDPQLVDFFLQDAKEVEEIFFKLRD